MRCDEASSAAAFARRAARPPRSRENQGIVAASCSLQATVCRRWRCTGSNECLVGLRPALMLADVADGSTASL